MKICIKCNLEKSFIEFYKRTENTYRKECKNCFRLAVRTRGCTPEGKIKQKDVNLRQYGLTLKQYTEMFTKQLGCCGICNKHQSKFDRSLAVDHDHISGVVRQLLCNDCNRGLGCFKDNPELILKALNYLTQYKQPKLKLIKGA